jgi:hypothetical protein
MDFLKRNFYFETEGVCGKLEALRLQASYNVMMCIYLVEYLNEYITNVGQSDVNLNSLALPCSRILLVWGGVYCRLCGGWCSWLPTYLVRE